MRSEGKEQTDLLWREFNSWRGTYGHSYWKEWKEVKASVLAEEGGSWTKWLYGKFIKNRGCHE